MLEAGRKIINSMSSMSWNTARLYALALHWLAIGWAFEGPVLARPLMGLSFAWRLHHPTLELAYARLVSTLGP